MLTCLALVPYPYKNIMFIKILCFAIGSLLTFPVHSAHHPETFLKSIAGKPDEGLLIVEHFCLHCHSDNPRIPVGAPPQGNTAIWKPRLQQGFDTIFIHTAEGINAMPARGGCFECSDEQLILAIAALLPKENKKAFILNMKAHK